MISLIEEPKIVKLLETEKQNGDFQGLQEGEEGELLFNGYGTSVLQDEIVLEICRVAMCIQLSLLQCTCKHSYDGELFVMCF